MNAILSSPQPLPVALQQPASEPSRRRLVGNHPLDRKGLDRFNQVLARLDRAPLDCDQLASAARQLAQAPAAVREPDCVPANACGARQ